MTDDVEIDSASIWPADNDDVDEGYLANWFVREGSAVDEGETIGEMQVEKVSIDVSAPTSGTVLELVVADGGEFTRGDVLARIRPSG